jgi:hypothetical protein
MSRILAVAYGVTSYLAFLGSFLYAVGFVGNLLVPKSIDSGPKCLLPASVFVNTSLLLLFAVPHNRCSESSRSSHLHSATGRRSDRRASHFFREESCESELNITIKMTHCRER